MPRRAAPKLDAMSLAELRQLRDEVQTALSGKIQMEREELQRKLNELSNLETGSVTSGTGQGGRGRPGNGEAGNRKRSTAMAKGRNGKSPLAGRKVEPKYRGPNGETWAGRGRAPRWLAELEAKGRKRESFLINK
jgi:DNA-binding protein H-NS